MAAAFVVAAGVLMGLPAHALAGQWMQISCVNPNGSAASSQGWSTTAGTDGSASAICNASTPMSEYLSANAPGGSGQTLQYNPPSGSTLAGGSLTVSGYSDGSGTSTQMGGAVYSPAPIYPDDAIFECIEGFSTNPCAQTNYTYSSQTVTLPANAGGTINVALVCSGGSSYSCSGPTDAAGDAGEMDVNSAQLLLSNESVPAGSGFTGTILDPDASGTADLVFTATDPSGPGVYQVTADVDANQVYSATPDTENGQCVPVGTDSASGALEFDYAQPCPQSVAVTVPVDTTMLKKGKHQLSVAVTDAAGNTATVYDGYITVDNTVTTPLPKATKGAPKVRVQFYATPDFIGAATRLVDISHSTLPTDTRVTLTDGGPRHPRLRLATATGARIKTMLADLSKLTFQAGDTVLFTVTAPKRTAERVRVTFHSHKDPTVKLI